MNMDVLKQKILSMVKDDLADIETALKQNLSPQFDLVSRVANHILFSGGKRLRPLIMILAARICGYNGNNIKTFSTIFEYMHSATLLHDDIVDDAVLRRGKAVAHSIWSNPIAVLVGDFLFARASSIAVETGDLKVLKIMAEVLENMSQGEIHQLIRKGNLDLSEDEYLEVIRRKTAILFQGASRVGALIAKATEDQEKALAEYGFNLGIAFQMADDLLDYTSDTTVLGKEVGADLKEGKVTLPVIYSLKKATSQDRVQMERIIKNKEFTVHDFEMLIKMLKKHEGITYTNKRAAEYVANAKNALLVFRPSKTREILLNIADYALFRKA